MKDTPSPVLVTIPSTLSHFVKFLKDIPADNTRITVITIPFSMWIRWSGTHLFTESDDIKCKVRVTNDLRRCSSQPSDVTKWGDSMLVAIEDKQ